MIICGYDCLVVINNKYAITSGIQCCLQIGFTLDQGFFGFLTFSDVLSVNPNLVLWR